MARLSPDERQELRDRAKVILAESKHERPVPGKEPLPLGNPPDAELRGVKPDSHAR